MKICDQDCFNCKYEDCIYDETDQKEYEEKYGALHGCCSGMGARLKRAIKANSINQAMLADRTGIAEPTISQYVHERICPKGDHIIILCKALGITSDWLLGINTYEGGE